MREMEGASVVRLEDKEMPRRAMNTRGMAEPTEEVRHHDRTRRQGRCLVPVPRRLRFEILRRDDHTCRYCGGKAPAVPLTVDHVKPTALGGKDEASNLVTACQPCNAGKASIAPDSPLVADVAADALRWSVAISWAAEERRGQRELVEMELGDVDDAWTRWSFGPPGEQVEIPRPSDWRNSVERFLELGLDSVEMTAHIDRAMNNTKVIVGEKWTYFCGCCWRSVDKLQEMAKGFIDAHEDA